MLAEPLPPTAQELDDRASSESFEAWRSRHMPVLFLSPKNLCITCNSWVEQANAPQAGQALLTGACKT